MIRHVFASGKLLLLRGHRSISYPLAITGLAFMSLACSTGPNPKKDLKIRVEARMQKHPYFQIENIQKYVKEQHESKDHMYYFQIKYRVTKPCLFNAMDAPMPNAVTLDLCTQKRGNFMLDLQPGKEVVETASLLYSNDKLAEVKFRSVNAFGGYGELEN